MFTVDVELLYGGGPRFSHDFRLRGLIPLKSSQRRLKATGGPPSYKPLKSGGSGHAPTASSGTSACQSALCDVHHPNKNACLDPKRLPMTPQRLVAERSGLVHRIPITPLLGLRCSCLRTDAVVGNPSRVRGCVRGCVRVGGCVCSCSSVCV